MRELIESGYYKIEGEKLFRRISLEGEPVVWREQFPIGGVFYLPFKGRNLKIKFKEVFNVVPKNVVSNTENAFKIISGIELIRLPKDIEVNPKIERLKKAITKLEGRTRNKVDGEKIRLIRELFEKKTPNKAIATQLDLPRTTVINIINKIKKGEKFRNENQHHD